MNRKLLFAATVAAMLASCSSDNLSVQPAGQDGRGQETAQGAVGFDAYLSRATSRNGAEGELTLNTSATGKVSLEGKGFGVFAYYTDNADYDGHAIPNFMWNQQVAKTANGWEYSPVKYWPNEFGSAKAEEADRVSFFAYAPYTEAEVASGKTAAATDPDTGNPTEAEGTGITAFSRNNATGDPLVKYVVNLDPKKAVDLCWGTVGEESVSWTLANAAPATQTFTKGLPWLDVQRPKLNGKVKFQFEHALSQLNIQVKNDVDALSPEASPGAAGVGQQTKVWIRSITLSGLSTMGALNLNNTAADKAKWLDYYDNKKLNIAETCTVYDGRKDGQEGTYADPSEEVTGLNPALVQSAGYDAITETDVAQASLNTTSTGVTSEYQNVFSGAASGTGAAAQTDPIYVIPNGGPMKVTIAYDVETYNPKLAGYLSDGRTHGTSVSNVITKDITFKDGDEKKSMVMENGKKYTIQLHLGLNGVKFTATVEPWLEAGEDEGWLPTKGLTLTLGSGRTMTSNGTSQSLTATTDAPTVSWTTSDDDIVDISQAAPSPTRGRRAGTRAEKTIGDTSVKEIYLIPKNVGTATITCVSEQGTASVVITVVKPKATPATVAAATGLKYGDTGALVTESGAAENGTMQYAVTTTDSAPADGYYSADVPTAEGRNAGTYYVWSKAVATNSATHDDSDAASVSVTIDKAPAEISFAESTVSMATGDTYMQTVTNTGNGAVQYRITNSGGSNATIDASTGEVNTGSKAGTATVTATVADSQNYVYATRTATYTITIALPPSPEVTPTVGNWGSSDTVDVTPDTGL